LEKKYDGENINNEGKYLIYEERGEQQNGEEE
jgi:hypothetical protein